MKRALFWILYAPIATTLLVISVIGLVLIYLDASFRAVVAVYDELLRRYERWSFDYVPQWPDENITLKEAFMTEFSNNRMSRT